MCKHAFILFLCPRKALKIEWLDLGVWGRFSHPKGYAPELICAKICFVNFVKSNCLILVKCHDLLHRIWMSDITMMTPPGSQDNLIITCPKIEVPLPWDPQVVKICTLAWNKCLKNMQLSKHWVLIKQTLKSFDLLCCELGRESIHCLVVAVQHCFLRRLLTAKFKGKHSPWISVPTNFGSNLYYLCYQFSLSS